MVRDGPCIEISFSKCIHNLIDKNMANSMVLTVLDNDYFLIKLHNKDDFDGVLTRGRSVIYGHALLNNAALV
ncbi:hypothetical protein Gotur_012816 [Gossypium turneri]|uniref:Uncharacterized protein n=1 Tax=Gossypium armourianum TaxID=34283 RepID=A0A7J9JLC9_9ROSI|nr:hypothetical protein [Gossypium armourianum]